MRPCSPAAMLVSNPGCLPRLPCSLRCRHDAYSNTPNGEKSTSGICRPGHVRFRAKFAQITKKGREVRLASRPLKEPVCATRLRDLDLPGVLLLVLHLGDGDRQAAVGELRGDALAGGVAQDDRAACGPLAGLLVDVGLVLLLLGLLVVDCDGEAPASCAFTTYASSVSSMSSLKPAGTMSFMMLWTGKAGVNGSRSNRLRYGVIPDMVELPFSCVCAGLASHFLVPFSYIPRTGSVHTENFEKS